MKYRKLGKIKSDLSVLGFGCMRFPTKNGNIDTLKSEEMLLYGIEKGINYLDTAWPYHNGESESFLGEFLEKYKLRNRINLATKLPSWLVKNRRDMDDYFEKQLEKLKTDYFDFYLIHALNQRWWDNLKKSGVFDFMEKEVKRGRIKHIGFSFHDQYPVYEKILGDYDWDFNMIQLNFYDQDFQAGVKGYNLSEKKGIPVVAMEPLRGGKLVNSVPDEINSIYRESERIWTNSEWALNWVWNHKNINLLLSGMSSLEHVKQNIAAAEKAEADIFTENDFAIIDKSLKILKRKTKIDCTGCGYCVPCPERVDIPNLFGKYNDVHVFGNFDEAKKQYQMFVKKESWAINCTECGLCLEKCPQAINIPKELKNVKNLFETED